MTNSYPDGALLVCADCGHEWSPTAEPAASTVEADAAVLDAHGQPLADGDSVVLIKDLKVKGSSITLKQGTRIKGIRLVGGDHEVDCRIDGGKYMLKAEFLKKA
jgi:protein PhnA